MARILIAEDEPAINNLIFRNISLVGHAAKQAFDGESALAMAQSEPFDLILLDVMLPKRDGFSVKAELPPEQPVIFVTAKSSLSNRLQGLGLGADDYIVKPFEILELLARMEAVLRRTGAGLCEFTVGDCRVEFKTHRVFVNDIEVALMPQEYALLSALIQNRNLALSREKLLELAWGYDFDGDARTVDVHIQKLRKKLKLEAEIQTVYKFGYRLAVGGEAQCR